MVSQEIMDAAKDKNRIVLPLICKRGCVFCVTIQNGTNQTLKPESLKDLPLDEWASLVGSLDYDKDIELQGGDVMDYPKVYDILNLIIDRANRLGKYPQITIVSTFADLEMDKIGIFESYPHFHLTMSVQTFDVAFKNTIMKGGWNKEYSLKQQELISRGLVRQANIWNFGSNIRLKSDFKIIKECLDRSGDKYRKQRFELILSYPCANRFSNEMSKQLNLIAMLNYESSAMLLKSYFAKDDRVLMEIFTVRELGSDALMNLRHHDSSVKEFQIRIKNALIKLNQEKVSRKDVVFIASQSVHDYAIKTFPSIPWLRVESSTYQGDTVVASLLTLDDVEITMRHASLIGKKKIVVLSKDMFSEGEGHKDIVGRDISSFESALGLRVIPL